MQDERPEQTREPVEQRSLRKAPLRMPRGRFFVSAAAGGGVATGTAVADAAIEKVRGALQKPEPPKIERPPGFRK